MGVRKLPYPPIKPNALITIKAAKGMSHTGAQIFASEDAMGFYVERHAWVQDAEGKKVESKGQVIILHDVCPAVEKLTGQVVIGGATKNIIVGKRLRNPDGTIHHVELELM